MVNFNYPAKYGIKFQDFGSWVDISHEEFLEDMGEQPEVFHISSYMPFMGMLKPTLTDTGRVSKNESSWIPIKDCVVITEPNNDNVLLLVPNLNEKVIPRATYWTPGKESAYVNTAWGGQWSGWSKRFTNAFVETGKMNWDRPLAERRRFKQKLKKLLMNLNHSWANPHPLNYRYANDPTEHWKLQTEIEDEAREKFLSVAFQNAKVMNDNYEKAKPTGPPYYLQVVVNKNTFLSNLQAVKNQYDWAMTGELDIKVLTEVRGLSPQGENIKLLNWTTSKQLLDYLDISPNPLRPFLWGLELIKNKNGKLVPYGWRESQQPVCLLLPLNKWRSVSPAKEWMKYSLGIESQWDISEAETFEAGSRYPPRYLDLSETGVCFVVTPHFQEQWNNLKRYGPSENKTLPELVGDWKDGLSWFWEELATPPMNEKYYYTKVKKGRNVVAYIYYVKRFNRTRNRPEVELMTVTPPSHPTGFGGVTSFGIPHADTTEHRGRMPFNAESFNWEAHDFTSAPRKGLCPICEGPIPDAEHRGLYPGAMSRFDNETEICSLCGSAEAIGPMMDEDAKITMMVGAEVKDWNMWRQGVNIGRGAVKEMMEASARATKIFKEGKVQIGDVTVEFEDITDEYMERNK